MRMIEKQNQKDSAKERESGETWTLDLDDDGESN